MSKRYYNYRGGKNTINIDKFTKLEINLNFDEIIKSNANDCCKDIINNSRNKGWKAYAEGWKITEKVDKKGHKFATVHNPEDYRLTHLLENGHLIVNKKGGVGYASPHPHIRPAFEKAKPRFIQDMKNVGIEIK